MIIDYIIFISSFVYDIIVYKYIIYYFVLVLINYNKEFTKPGAIIKNKIYINKWHIGIP